MTRCLAKRLSGLALLVGAVCSSSIGAAQPSLAPRVFAVASDGRIWLDPQRDHLALTREMPTPFVASEPPPIESEAVRFVFQGPAAVSALRISSRRENGDSIDVLADPALVAFPCPAKLSGTCWATPPLRLSPDRLDRDYAATRERSLEAELGGEIRVEVAGQLLAEWRVGAPHSALFASADRFALKLRVRVLRVAAGGAPAIGSDAASAVEIARAEVQAASKVWAQCGIDLQGPNGPDIQVVDPPPVSLISVGCDSGLPASGGQLSLLVQGHHVRVASQAGESPRVVAARLARALNALGLKALISPNQAINSGVSGSVDVLARSASGAPVAVSVDAHAGTPLSTDPTLSVCLGEVDLGNGLSHFVETDAAAGTVEERSLIKALDDGDPSTIDVLIIPSFDQSGRIGESFIDDDGAGIQNTVLIDRAALRAGPRSYALAHEIGHILLDMPGHPDDYGVDQSSSLMDSDASDASVFGPRRLSLADCERALIESGPAARVPLLQAWPLKRRPPGPAGAPPTSAR